MVYLNFLDCATSFDPDRLLSNYVQIMLRLWLSSVDKPSGACQITLSCGIKTLVTLSRLIL